MLKLSTGLTSSIPRETLQKYNAVNEVVVPKAREFFEFTDLIFAKAEDLVKVLWKPSDNE